MKTLTCLGCPRGCALTVELADDEVWHIQGNNCPRGIAYGQQELTAPKRMLTTTVRMADGKRLPVVSRWPLPKDSIPVICQELRNLVLNQPLVRCGEVIAADVDGSGVEIIAACDYPFCLSSCS